MAKRMKKVKLSVKKAEAPKMTAPSPVEKEREDEWRTRDDADQLMRSAQIHADSKRFKAAADHIQRTSDHVNALRKGISRQGRRKAARNIGR